MSEPADFHYNFIDTGTIDSYKTDLFIYNHLKKGIKKEMKQNKFILIHRELKLNSVVKQYV